MPLLLLADAHVTSITQQYLLGALTFGVLLLGLRGSEWNERRVVLLCVALATGLEVFGSLIWGEYRYRFANVPLYVPAGHGMVCLFALRTAKAPFVQRHGRGISMVILAIAGTWALAGVSVIPWYLGGRKDTGGALLFPIFAAFILGSARYRYFVGIFVATTVLELFGTGFGNWTWAVSAPVVHFGAGNPPSVIAGAYCVLDGAVLMVAAAGARIAPWLLRRDGWSPGGGRSRWSEAFSFWRARTSWRPRRDPRFTVSAAGSPPTPPPGATTSSR